MPTPLYRYHIFFCTNERPPDHKIGCCKTKGNERLRDYMKQKALELKLGPSVRVNNAGCLGRCQMGPTVVIYPEGVWYSPKSEKDCDEIIEQHLQQGKIVERLLIAT